MGALRLEHAARAAPALLDDTALLLAQLRAGDLLSFCHGVGWHLVRADTPVASAAVTALQLSAPGRLLPAGDTLPGIGTLSQTWAWVEAGPAGPALLDVFDVRNLLRRLVAEAGGPTAYAKQRTEAGHPLTTSQVTDVTGGHKPGVPPAVMKALGLCSRYVALAELRRRR